VASKNDEKIWGISDFVEKAEIYNALTPVELEQFLKLIPAKYKDRVIAEAMKLRNKSIKLERIDTNARTMFINTLRKGERLYERRIENFDLRTSQYLESLAKSDKDAEDFYNGTAKIQGKDFADLMLENAKEIIASNSKANNSNQTAKMAKLLNNEEIEKAAQDFANLGDDESDAGFLESIHGLSRKKVHERGLELRRKKENQPKQSNPKNSNTMADTKTRKSPVVLDPANNKTHKVLLGISKLHTAAKATNFAGFDKKNLREKQQGLAGKELAAVFERQFQTLRRKFLAEDGKVKPLMDPENPLHPKALAVLNEMMAEGKEKGGAEIAKNAESWLNRIETVYATEKKGGTGRKPAAAKVDINTADFWSF
jgi:hypothetical protein